MYAKLFSSIFQGTLRGNTHGLLVFANLLSHADKAGIVDIHPRAIADELGLTIEQVQVALDGLEAPDPNSRTPDEEGRRIAQVDGHRTWGWRIVNHAKYRAIRSEDDRREQNRLAQAVWREKQKALHKQSKPASASCKTDKPIQRQRHIQKQIQGAEVLLAREALGSASPPPKPVDNSETEQPTPAVSACRAIAEAGIMDASPGDADLGRLLAAGVSSSELAEEARKLVKKGKPRFSLLVATVEGRRRDASAAGDVPAAQVAPWHQTGPGVVAKGLELGCGGWSEDEWCAGLAPNFLVYRAKVYAAAGFKGVT